MDQIKQVLDLLNSPLGAAVLLCFVGYQWLKHRFAQLEKRAARVERIVANQSDLFTVLITALGGTRGFPKEAITKLYATRSGVVDQLVQDEIASTNPLTRDEAMELKVLTDALHSGQMLDYPGAQRLHQLAEKMKIEQPDRRGAWVLAGLAALILGWAITEHLSQQKKG